MPIIKQSWIKRADLRANPDVLYVFGDNMMREGLGGQAAEMRGEPNAVGIPTKHFPSMSKTAFFTDDDLPNVQPEIDLAFMKIRRHLIEGGIVVWPMDGVGSGLSQLPERAPKIDAYIKSRLVD